MTDVQMPDGTLIQGVPDGVTQSQLMAQYTQHQQAQNQPSFMDRLHSDYSKRDQEITNSANAYAWGQQSAPETWFQNAMSGGAKFTDTVGEGINAVTPQIVKDDVGALAKGAIGIAGSLPSFGGRTIGERIPQELAANPRLARNLNAVGEGIGIIGSAIPVKNVANNLVSDASKLAGYSGDALYQSGESAFNAQKNKFVQDLITPKETPGVKSDLFSRSSEEGIFRTRVPEPTPQEQSIMQTLSKLPVSKNRSLLSNYNIISDAKDAEAENLMTHLAQNDVSIPDETISSGLSAVQEDLTKSPYITGDGAQKSVQNVISGAKEIIAQNPQTASGLLQSRKDFDAWVSRYKSNAFDPATAGPVTDAVQRVRQTLNNIVADAAPDVGVKQSLLDQSNMYRAMDAIETKGGYEGKNILTRTAQRAADYIPVKGVLAKGAVLAGGGAAATAGGLVAPALTAGAAGTYLAAKAAMSPRARMLAGLLMKGAGKAGEVATDPKLYQKALEGLQ